MWFFFIFCLAFYNFYFPVPGPDRWFISHRPMLKKINATKNNGPLHYKLRVFGMSRKLIYNMNSRDEDYRVPIWETGKQKGCYNTIKHMNFKPNFSKTFLILDLYLTSVCLPDLIFG